MSPTEAATHQPETEPRRLWTPDHLRSLGIDALRNSSLIHTAGEPDQLQVLADLEPVVETELNRHDSARKLWFARNLLPLDDEGRVTRFVKPGEEPFLTPTAQAAMILNLLTEDNLPAYHRIIAANFGMDGAWGTWVNKWTAEENRHAYVMRAFLDLTRAVDTEQLELDRMKQMEQGFDDGDKDPLHTLVYVTFQELATRVSHKNTGEATQDPLASVMLSRIAMDENLHMVFYRNLVAAAFELAPNQVMRAITDEVQNFAMPGANMAGFLSKSLLIARAGIYDLRKHKDEVIKPILRQWNVWKRTDLSGEGEAARQELGEFIHTKLEKRVQRFEDQRDSGMLDKIIERALAGEATQRPVGGS
jgi:acyl-[acyl-carrier-protein] desaturase